MGQHFSLPRLIGMEADAASAAGLDLLESELLLQIVRVLVRDEPQAIGRLVCSCKTLAQLATSATGEGKELRKARRVAARQWLFDLRELAGRTPAALAPLVTQVSRQLSFKRMCPSDEPRELDLTRWRRAARPAHDDRQRGAALKRVLYANQSLTSVDLSVCYLTYMDATEIAKGLKVHTALSSLNASGNFFGGFGRDGKFVFASDGVGAIAEALCVSRLTNLSLGENRLGPEGVRALVPGLGGTCLTSLDLSRNGLGVEGAAALAVGLASNRSLRKLDVRLNKLGPEGAKALAPGVAACGSLSALDARFNGVEEDAGEGEAALRHATSGRLSFELLLNKVEWKCTGMAAPPVALV